ncbi:hypothetical protein CYCD_06530 [Tenuifilaceae bacterium CYCD]|nr:hypothetical protein CYCD_06530 [Tenuifilaceae bacterium CYCD]
MNKAIDYKEIAKSLLFGVVTGDVLGVPFEFKNRQTLKQNPAKDMIGYGTHNQPTGTFSDDSSLTFCLAEALTEGFDLNTIGQNFVKWHDEGFWTARGEVYDVGNATRQAINKLAKGVPPEISGGFEETDNGNGSLMRILPLIFYIKEKPIRERFEITKQVSSITHGHTHSIIACFYCLEFALQKYYLGKTNLLFTINLKLRYRCFLIQYQLKLMNSQYLINFLKETSTNFMKTR